MRMGAVCLGLRVITWSSEWVWHKNRTVLLGEVLNRIFPFFLLENPTKMCGVFPKQAY